MTHQLQLVGVEPRREIRDELDRCYTPDRLADAVVASISVELVEGATVVEPSFGGGAFLRAIRRRWSETVHVVAVDVDPEAPGRLDYEHDECLAGSWPAVATEWAGVLARRGCEPAWMALRPDVIVGNPPFAEAVDHVKAALALRPQVVSMILPWSYWGVDYWAELLHGAARPAVVRPIMPRPWGDRVRETAVYEWHPRTLVAPGATRIELLPGWR